VVLAGRVLEGLCDVGSGCNIRCATPAALQLRNDCNMGGVAGLLELTGPTLLARGTLLPESAWLLYKHLDQTS